MRINDLENRTGLDRATIRYYEKEGMIAPERRENGYRDYSEADRAQLLKIKLLRQLGMPLSKIKQLQQGSADLSVALQDQIAASSQQLDDTQRSIHMCKRLREDSVTYETMNAEQYLEEFMEMDLQHPEDPCSAPAVTYCYSEQLEVPYHPFLHLFARFADLVLTALLIIFLQVILLRTGWNTRLLNPLSPLFALAFVPLEALMYWLFGTTPGKLIFGIQVFHINGGRHSLSTGISRAFRAYRFGWGWGTPIWRLWRLIRSYGDYERNENDWNDESEIIYNECRVAQITAWILTSVFVIGGAALSLHMVDLPRHNADRINIQQFSENYNDYLNRNDMNPAYGMNKDGSFNHPEPKQGSVTVLISGRTSDTYPDLEYIMDGDAVRGFTCTDQFTYKYMVDLLPIRYSIATISLLASVPGVSNEELTSFLKDFHDSFHAEVGKNQTSFVYETERIIVRWKLEYDGNCQIVEFTRGLALLNENMTDPSGAMIYFSAELKD